MTGEGVRYGLVMLAAGVGIPILAALNAQLGARLGSPAAAAVCLFAVGFLVAVLALLATGVAPIRALPRQPAYLFGGGVLVAFYILSITWIAPHIGLGNAVILVLLGQMLTFSFIDHFGLFGALQKPLNPQRIIGVVMLAAGAFLAIRA
jgi:transporter family-2 protein